MRKDGLLLEQKRFIFEKALRLNLLLRKICRIMRIVMKVRITLLQHTWS